MPPSDKAKPRSGSTSRQRAQAKSGSSPRRSKGRVAAKRRSTAQIIAGIGSTLVSSLVLEEVLATVAAQIGEALDVWWLTIHNYSRERDTLTYEAGWCRDGLTQEDIDWVGTVIDLKERPDWRRVVDPPQVVEAHIDDPDLPVEERESMEQWRYTSTLDAPLMYAGEVIGELGVAETGKVRRFTVAERELFFELCNMAAIAIHNAKTYRRQEEQTRHFSSLLESGRAITATVDLDEVLARLAREVTEVLQVGFSVAYEYDDQRDRLVARAIYERTPSPAGPDLIGTAYALADYPSERLTLAGDDVREEHFSDSDLPADRRRSMAAWSEQTCLSVPLRFEGKPVGTLRLYETARERHFIESERQLAMGLGEQAAIAINNARSYRRQELQNRRLVTLLESSRTLTAAVGEDKAITSMKVEIAKLLGDGDCHIDEHLAGGDADTTEPADPLADEVVAETSAVKAPRGDKLAAKALKQRKPVWAALDAERTRLVVPIVLKKTACGYLDFVGPRSWPLGEDELEFAQIVANQTAATIENTRLYETIERQAITDGLTGIYNHRFFYERLRTELVRARRYSSSLSLLMIDVDDFKWFNDQYGHQAGDRVLHSIGRLLAADVRCDVDVPCRYGGEEFTVILPNTPVMGAGVVGARLHARISSEGVAPMAAAPAGEGNAARSRRGDGAEHVGERLRERIATASFRAESGVEFKNVTVSIGVAAYPEHAADVDGLVVTADKALYDAKRRGKNRVVVAPFEE